MIYRWVAPATDDDGSSKWEPGSPQASMSADSPASLEYQQARRTAIKLGTSSIAPRTQVEKLVADIWQQVLGVPQVGIHDDFFELGGTSLLVTETISRLNETFQVDLSVLSLIESPTVAGLAQCIEAVHRTAALFDDSTLIARALHTPNPR
jgi:acyl carrier protein